MEGPRTIDSVSKHFAMRMAGSDQPTRAVTGVKPPSEHLRQIRWRSRPIFRIRNAISTALLFKHQYTGDALCLTVDVQGWCLPQRNQALQLAIIDVIES